MYSKEDQDEILRLCKVAIATQTDMDSIYELLKKYVRPKAAPYIIGCNCQRSIGAYYQELLEWYSKNGSKFNTTPDWQKEFGVKTIKSTKSTISKNGKA